LKNNRHFVALVVVSHHFGEKSNTATSDCFFIALSGVVKFLSTIALLVKLATFWYHANKNFANWIINVWGQSLLFWTYWV